MPRRELALSALAALPEVRPGDDLGGLIAAAAPPDLRAGDVLAVAHKVVSKAEARLRPLGEVGAGSRALELATEQTKDPRLVQVILEESAAILRAERGVLVCETHHGLVCANAGVDASNVPGDDTVVLLPADPDRSARGLRDRLGEALGVRPAVLITDSFGRAWRVGQTDVAIGAAGLVALEDWRGRRDSVGRELRATIVAVADAVAGAADLVRDKDGRTPVVLIRGLDRWVTPEDGPGAAALRRRREEDLFR